MGNCVETCTQKQEQEHIQMQQQQQHEQEDYERENDGRFVKENILGKDGNIRVKIVLTKEELGWLMLQLKDSGGRNLEDVLQEIQKSRAKAIEGWKPSLESIMECPEVIEMDR
ncbi:uncharacterized protein LOC126624950 [Malus sylvestris]|uniref:uncharacterized protein LOC126624950 n=1 Tax=Malus sylvestris TaxID=3752 RepID=UPI0010AA90B1|nr:uncharacterized protein LOC103420268 [Malus domestica]XP_050149960.1 uncharacterized protein LOC126624950 [Malus sylvestris]